MIRAEEAADIIPEAIVRENPVHVMKTVLYVYSLLESILNMISPAVTVRTCLSKEYINPKDVWKCSENVLFFSGSRKHGVQKCWIESESLYHQIYD